MSNRGEGGLGVILSIVALAAMGAFMYWLNLQSREIEMARVEAEAAALDEERDLNAGDLMADPRAALGRRVVIQGIRVATGLGQGAFALALSDSVAYPVLMESDPIQRLRMANITIYGGDSVFVSGQIFTYNDSIGVAWVTSGAVQEGMGERIPMSPTFLLADSVLVH
ncbi:hypothetical protein [Candidatus Palauibacter sp.]|uniref:hypothetical protein n=1 Tax=Candidatus Palauibacter sp. TaxID=3101350 RepID=UPI003B591CC0